jgi:ATP-dependent protease ClpP protease subunit
MNGPTLVRRLLAACLLSSLFTSTAPAAAAPPTRRATAATTSRWWDLACDGAPTAPCVFTVRLRGAINADRVQLLKTALLRRDDSLRATGRPISLRIDADTHGGSLYAALEIGRMLRQESASIAVGSDAQCSSACVFVLMGAPKRRIAPGARIGIHRPSLDGDPTDATVDALIPQLIDYADEMGVPRRLVDDMMSIPSKTMHYLSARELADYGLTRSPPR